MAVGTTAPSWSSSMRDAAAAPLTLSHTERAALAEKLERWRRVAQETWPGVACSEARFEATLMALLAQGALGFSDESGSHASLSSVHGPDLYLACAALDGQAQALSVLRDMLEQELDKALRRFRASHAALDDARQLARARVLVDDGERKSALSQYTGRGALRAFLRVTSTRTCLNLLQQEGRDADRRERDDELLSALPSPLVDPEMALLRQTSRDEFRAAFREAVSSLDARARTLLRQHYVDRLQPGELGPLYAVHRTTALRWLEDASQALVRATRRALQKRLHASPEDVDSLMRALGSQLDLSLRAYLS
jgi:RNA polymerase sigma-70 factor (ECF subfamily)